ncbi:hypothetical protein D9M73_223310 [compost metagenome]
MHRAIAQPASGDDFVEREADAEVIVVVAEPEVRGVPCLVGQHARESRKHPADLGFQQRHAIGQWGQYIGNGPFDLGDTLVEGAHRHFDAMGGGHRQRCLAL